MKTLYVDVYFLINFTIDLLALYFSVILLSMQTKLWRLLTSAFWGATIAVAAALLPESLIFELLLLLLFIILVAIIGVKGASILRRVRLTIVFLFFEMMIGGLVQLLYNLLDKHFKEYLSSILVEVNNKRLLLIAALILFVIIFLNLVLDFLESRAFEGAVEVELTLFEKIVRFDCLIDSGNLAKDPMDGSGVLFVKKRVFDELLIDMKEFNVHSVSELAKNERIKRRLRLVPVKIETKNKMFIGVKPDSVRIKTNGSYESVELTVAIDEEGGKYGSYDGLIPSAVVKNAIIIK